LDTGNTTRAVKGRGRKGDEGRRAVFEGEPEEGRSSGGDRATRHLRRGVRATDWREEQSPEGGHENLERPGNREQGPRANDKRATASDELVRLLVRENP
jgi:hypothetical protein